LSHLFAIHSFIMQHSTYIMQHKMLACKG
jgi:hypothetical protein